MASIVYSLCAPTSVLCSVLLLTRYRRRHEPVLLWSALCFCGLASNNLLLFVDYIAMPAIDLSLYRSISAAAAVTVRLAGLIWES